MSKWKIENIEGLKVTVSILLSQCKNCQKPMMDNWGRIPYEIEMGLKKADVQKESYRKSDICDTCLKTGGFKRECSICGSEQVFPAEFIYEIQYYPKYPDDDTTYLYICRECVTDNPKEVIKVMAKSNETNELGVDK